MCCFLNPTWHSLTACVTVRKCVLHWGPKWIQFASIRCFGLHDYFVQRIVSQSATAPTFCMEPYSRCWLVKADQNPQKVIWGGDSRNSATSFQTWSAWAQSGGTLSSYCGGGVSGSTLNPAAGWELSIFFMCSFSDLILRILMGRSLRLVFPGLWFDAETAAEGPLEATAGCDPAIVSSDPSFSYCTPSTCTRSS